MPGDAARLTMVVWATLQGLAATANAGLLGDTPLDELIADAVKGLTDGMRPR